MQCPRCGFRNDDFAYVCRNCGYSLPSVQTSGPLNGRSTEVVSNTSTGPFIPSQELPAWLVPQQDGNGTPLGRGSVIPPSAPAPYDTPQRGYPTSDQRGQSPQEWTWGQQPNSVPASNSVSVQPTFSLPQQNPMAVALPDTAGAFGQALGPGTLLKGGRYRLIQPLHPTRSPQSQDADPPLMLASDAELPEQRVLIQEIALGAMAALDGQNIRRGIAQRYQEAAKSAQMPMMLDNFSERQRHFLVFELPSGELLIERLQRARGSMDEVAAIKIALQVLDSLVAFEQQYPPMIHGSLSPAHLLLRPSGQVMVLGCSPTLLIHPDGIVPHGVAGGTPGYAAPEQARGQASPRSDLYALCAVLHHCVTGVAPSPRIGATHQQARHLNPNVSLELEEVLSRGLRPSSTQRYQNAPELRRALQVLASGQQLTHVPETLRAENEVPQLSAPVRDARGRLVLPTRRLSQNPLFVFGIVIIIVLIISSGFFITQISHSAKPTVTTSLAASDDGNTLALYQRGIALSDGEEIFDTQRLDNMIKNQAAQAIAGGNIHGALNDFQNAMSQDQSDPEAAIYAEDQRIAINKTPFVTVVAAVAFASDTASARAELQGVFIAQQNANMLDTLPGGINVRVLILNSGKTPDDAQDAASLVLNQMVGGNPQHIIGLIGWPTSAQTRSAMTMLRTSGLPLLSPTAGADDLTGGGGNFFTMAPSDAQQGNELATASVTQFNGHRIAVLSDASDPVSVSVAKSFATQTRQYFQTQGAIALNFPYTSGAADFSNQVHDAVSQGCDLFFLASGPTGADQDAMRLAQAVAHVNALSGSSLRVLLDSYAFTPALVGQGDTVAAQLARSQPSALRVLMPTTLAYAHEWDAVGISNDAFTAFLTNYSGQFGVDGEQDGLNNPNPMSIISYDSTSVLLAAAARVASASPSPSALGYAEMQTGLLAYKAGHPFIGVSGATAFTQEGSQVLKALALLSLTPLPQTPSSGPVADVSVSSVIGGASGFCGGSSTCKPS